MRLKRPERSERHGETPRQQVEQLRRYLSGLVKDLEIELDEVERRLIRLENKMKEVEEHELS